MLAVSPLRNTNNDENQREMESFQMGFGNEENLPDFTDGNNFLDCINFEDIFTGINEGDILPDLGIDHEIFAEFSSSGGEEFELNAAVCVEKVENSAFSKRKREDDKVSSSGKEERVSKKDESMVGVNLSSKETGKGRKSSSQCKNSQGKRKKAKVDWTPELHRRFVQAVQQLGVEKAVPSRILELMGIDHLTRHNIASHLQKYRSHRKHLLAREAEAASWNQRRHMCAAAIGGGGGCKRDIIYPWIAPPTMGFPLAPPMHHHLVRPLHVWGDPTIEKSPVPIWPKHMPHSQSPPPPPPQVAPAWPPADPLYWHTPPQPIPNALTPGTPCFPQQVTAPTRFAAHPPVPGIPPHSVYKVDPGIGVPTGKSGHCPLFDFHLSKESIDAALGDVLVKPWLPLPIGLKPPTLDCVMVELQRQGISRVPPDGSDGSSQTA